MIKQQLQERYLSWTAIDNGMLVFLLIVFAVVCGISGFAYLHSRKKTDFYHAIPVKRERLFTAVYLNGVLYTAVPYLISLLISSLMIQVKAGQIFPWGEVLKTYCIHMSFFLLMYTVVIAAALMTGNTIVNVLGSAVFFLWGPGTAVSYTHLDVYKRQLYRTAAGCTRHSVYVVYFRFHRLSPFITYTPYRYINHI